MTRPKVLAGAALLLLCPALRASAEPVCALPEVLRVLQGELHRHGIHGALDERSVGEVSEPENTGAACAVRVVFRGGDTDRFGPRPIEWAEVHRYRVTRLRNGLLVRLSR